MYRKVKNKQVKEKGKRESCEEMQRGQELVRGKGREW